MPDAMTPTRAPHPLMSHLDTLREELGVPGAAVALMGPKGLIFAAHSGHADPAGRPFAAPVRFPIFSVTKTLLAALVLLLADDGHVQLDEPLARYFPEYPELTRATIRQTLNHTGGFPEYGSWATYVAAVRGAPEQPWTPLEFIEQARTTGPLFEPGHGWAYSNIGYLFLRLLVERVTGQTLGDALQARLFAPLHLSETTVLDDLEDMAGVTPGLSTYWSGGELQDVRSRYHPGWVAHGLVASTAEELAVVTDAIFRGPVLSAKRRAEQRHAVLVGGEDRTFGPRGYGLGVMLDAAHPERLVGHAGGGPGYGAGVLHAMFPNGNCVTSVALVNRDLDDAAISIAAALLEAHSLAGNTG